MTYAVTGATGGFGSLAVQHLLKQGVAPGAIVAVVRDPAKAVSLKTQGVTVRVADYSDVPALEAALKDVDRLLLVSGSDPGQRLAQHKNLIAAAKKAGVKLVAYTSITQADTSTNILAPDHKATEEALKASGLPTIVLRNNWYAENYAGDVAGAKQSGVVAAAVTKGKVGSALRSEYAEAAVKALVGGQAGKVYELGGAPWSYQEFAETAGKVLGKPVKYLTVSQDDKKKTLLGFGLPDGVAGFYAALDGSIEAGTLAFTSGDLAKLLGRAPANLEAQIRALAG